MSDSTTGNTTPPAVSNTNNTVSLGCGTLIIIALIVLFFSGGRDVDKLQKSIDELESKIDRLEMKLDELSKR
jgi:outer membrane murein-binding lipoprotein Lpp